TIVTKDKGAAESAAAREDDRPGGERVIGEVEYEYGTGQSVPNRDGCVMKIEDARYVGRA
ncbi:hypothetical protein B1218_36930, partial [Pseudomonas ogarae]